MKTSGRRLKILKARRRRRIAGVLACLLVIFGIGLFIWNRNNTNDKDIEPTAMTESSNGEATFYDTSIAVIPAEDTAQDTTSAETSASAVAAIEDLSTASQSSTAEEAASEIEQDNELQDLEAELEEYISQKEGYWSIYIKQVDSPNLVEINADNRMRSGNLNALFISGCCLDVIEKREINQGQDEIKSKIEEMFVSKDNISCNELIDIVGIDRINLFAQENDFMNTVFGIEISDQQKENYTSAKDCAAVLEKIADGSFVSKESSDFILSCLGKNGTDVMFSEKVSDGIRVSNITNEWEEGIENKAAIIWTSRNTYILCIMSENSDSKTSGDAYNEISNKILDFVVNATETNGGNDLQ